MVVSILTLLFDGGMNRESGDCDALIRCTTNALDDVELQKLVVSAQQVNFQLNIEYGVWWEDFLIWWLVMTFLQ